MTPAVSRAGSIILCVAALACGTTTEPTPPKNWRTLTVPAKAPADDGERADACATLRALSFAVAQGGADAERTRAATDLFSEFQAGTVAPKDANQRAKELAPDGATTLGVELHDEMSGLFRTTDVALFVNDMLLLDERGQVGCPSNPRQLFAGAVVPGRYVVRVSFLVEGTSGYLASGGWRLRDGVAVNVAENDAVVVKLRVFEDRTVAPEKAEKWPTLGVSVTPPATRLAAPPPVRSKPLSKLEVLQVIKAKHERIVACARANGERGVVKMAWTIEPSGVVTDVAIAQSRFVGSPTGTCVANEIATWVFPATELATPVTFPMNLEK